jgi:hypothetical protein
MPLNDFIITRENSTGHIGEEMHLIMESMTSSCDFG